MLGLEHTRRALEGLTSLIRRAVADYPIRSVYYTIDTDLEVLRGIAPVLAGSDDELRAFVFSGNLWGGMGSIRDSLLCDIEREPVWRERDVCLIALAKAHEEDGLIVPSARSVEDYLRRRT